jgi:adenosylmethionine---8-amino-7-oxononanoate aminotransferase
MTLVDSARSCGLIGAIELQHGRTAAARVCEQALSEGVWLRPLGNVIVIMPPLCVTLEELDCICGAVQEGLLRTAASITGQ